MRYSRIIYVVLLSLLFSCGGQKGVKFVKGDLSDVLALAQKQMKPILVDFYSPT